MVIGVQYVYIRSIMSKQGPKVAMIQTTRTSYGQHFLFRPNGPFLRVQWSIMTPLEGVNGHWESRCMHKEYYFPIWA